MIFQERKWAFEKRCLLPPLWTADPLIGLGWTRTTGEPAARSFVVARTWKIQKEIHTKSIQIQIHFGLRFMTLCADTNWLKTLTKKDVKNLAGRHIFLQDYWWQRARWGWYRTRSPPRSQNTDGRFQPSLSSQPRFLPLKDSGHQSKGFDTRTVKQLQSLHLKPWQLCWNFVEYRVMIPTRSVTNVHCELWTFRLLAVWTIKGRSN